MKSYILIFLSFIYLACDSSSQKKEILTNKNEISQTNSGVKLNLITIKEPLERELNDFIKKLEKNGHDKKSKKSILIYLKDQNENHMDILLASDTPKEIENLKGFSVYNNYTLYFFFKNIENNCVINIENKTRNEKFKILPPAPYNNPQKRIIFKKCTKIKEEYNDGW
ncbi:hypothetical protein LF887_18135 [Chryseobacterium sp. MEBOG06]|uniref:hypothetical protein n=1 Tax=Chryseobacterium sp. MEBOG06 TaxID=2879938 RepID=UPI001F32043F|nr:hypothetical protein [Chryseobacterium sp. MEBOG06]UKB82915.1 hypothetical protein LF887_18135 [Chryseobacterium sp. MEBOG06]